MLRAFRAAVCALLAAWMTAPAVAAPPLEQALEQTAAVSPQRAFVLVFDYPVGGLRQEEEVQSSLEAWIASDILPGDLVAVASYYGSELQIEQDFTADRQALSEAIADAIRGRTRESSPAPPGTPSLLARLPQGEELTHRTTTFYGVLQVLAEASDGVPGRKNLLVFSKGFGRSRFMVSEVVAAPELGIEELLPALAESPESPLLGKYASDRDLYEPTLEVLRSHGIALYPVDMATDYRETYPLAGVMSQLAAATGGRYFYPAEDLPKLFARVLEDDPRERPAAADPEEEVVAGAGGGRGESGVKAREE